MHTGWFCQCIW